VIDEVRWIPDPLTPRQIDVLEVLVEEGASNAVIARKLWLSEHTVKQHILHAMQKTGAINRTHLALLYVKQEKR
jgi:DNA-binding CsgD family transcriptional regulator